MPRERGRHGRMTALKFLSRLTEWWIPKGVHFLHVWHGRGVRGRLMRAPPVQHPQGHAHLRYRLASTATTQSQAISQKKKKKSYPSAAEAKGPCRGAGVCALVLGLIGREGRKEIRADVRSLLTRLTPLIPMQITREGEAEKVIFKAFTLNSELLKNQKRKHKSPRD